ncbi:aspartate/glutamate racemase family protein [Bacillus sp. RG28]|uniref:Aspartate/glutamate racemase family protein n=1 Tax=Gottfriedia endophytica TaxID=2820819 RepID=A0A940NRB6_9BACI|nr:amino acid racemase [Gottfriedia endophytica]MBP0726360.1 aspartate/glutamate racemase family protein [Gottfriedia endophytica]
MDYKLGVIGGMGPQATSVFFQKIIENTAAYKDQDHINMVILNHSTLPDRTSLILNQKEEILEYIYKDIQLLESIGVNHIAIPCNTVHYFYKEMNEITNISIINMVEETVKKIYKSCGKQSKVGILATSGTIKSGIYKEECEKYGLTLHIPNEEFHQKTMDIIYKDVKGELNTESSKLEEIIADLIHQEDYSCVILACTELSCIKLSDAVLPYCIDAMDVLVEKAITLSGNKLKKKSKSEVLST